MTFKLSSKSFDKSSNLPYKNDKLSIILILYFLFGILKFSILNRSWFSAKQFIRIFSVLENMSIIYALS